MESMAFTLADYMILRAAAQKYQEKQETMLKGASGAARRKVLENIINLDLAISRCDRRECSFTLIECAMLTDALQHYRGILPESSESAHLMIPVLFRKLAALCDQMRLEDAQDRPGVAIRDAIGGTSF